MNSASLVAKQAARIDNDQLTAVADVTALAVQRAQAARRMAELSPEQVKQVSGGASLALSAAIIAGGKLLAASKLSPSVGLGSFNVPGGVSLPSSQIALR